MHIYRLYCMSGHGQMGHVEPLEAKDDKQAVTLAFAKKLPVDCEVWDGDRLVAQVSAHLSE